MSQPFPDLSIIVSPNNPVIKSPFVPYQLEFYQTKYSLMDIDRYTSFVKNAVSRFRASRAYKNYKFFLMNLGMDRCQINNNITMDMATIEMHHNMLTIFDIAFIITEHIINTTGYITSFDLVQHLRKVHHEHKVMLVMLNLTAHQLYHNTNNFFIHPDMCFGNWGAFLEEYKYGITIEIANKVIRYLDEAIKVGSTQDNGLMEVRDHLVNWSRYNEYNLGNQSYNNTNP